MLRAPMALDKTGLQQATSRLENVTNAFAFYTTHIMQTLGEDIPAKDATAVTDDGASTSVR